MGSYSTSKSDTQYTNAPVTQEDVTNPLNLINSTARFGSDINAGGSITFNTDAATVGQAFAFGSDLVKVIADMTRQNNAAASAAGKDEVVNAVTGQSDAAADELLPAEYQKYKPLIYIGIALAAWYIWKHK